MAGDGEDVGKRKGGTRRTEAVDIVSVRIWRLRTQNTSQDNGTPKPRRPAVLALSGITDGA